MKTKVFLSGVFILFFISGIFAQSSDKRWGFELSAGPSVATQKLGGSTLNPGVGFEGIFHYRFMPYTGIYGGWGWNKFGADESFAGNDRDFEETGYVLGIQFKRPFGESSTAYYLRAGGLYNHIEIEDGGDVTYDSGHGFGWQLAAGVDFNLGSNWSLTPGIKFNALNRDVRHEGVDVPLELNYVSLRFGLLKKF